VQVDELGTTLSIEVLVHQKKKDNNAGVAE
jgi:hypothetical protein